jgi:Na+-driven multidrug efflux pump
VGTTTLVAHAVGRRDRERANLVFNQAQVLSAVVGTVFLALALALKRTYAEALSADAVTRDLTDEYLAWFIPSQALTFLFIAMGAALRGTGNFRPGMIVQTATVIINIVLAIAVWLAAAPMVQVFSPDPAVINVGEEYLHVVAWNFVASGVIFVSSSMFQAMGNTIPSLITSALRIVLIAVPVVLLANARGFALVWVWYISVAGMFVQLGLNLLLLRREFRKRLAFEPTAAAEA